MKPVRRVVTGHRDGKAVVLYDSAAPNQRLRQASGLVSTLVWATDETPADISGSADRAAREIGVPPPPGGPAFRLGAFPPPKAPRPRRGLPPQLGGCAPGRARPPRPPPTRSAESGAPLGR